MDISFAKDPVRFSHAVESLRSRGVPLLDENIRAEYEGTELPTPVVDAPEEPESVIDAPEATEVVGGATEEAPRRRTRRTT